MILHTGKNLAVMSYVQINSSTSINGPKEQGTKHSATKLSRVSSLHRLLLLSTTQISPSIHQHTKMAEKASAARLIRVYRAEKQRRDRPLPRRGQIKLKIAHIVVRSIASTLLRAISPLPVLDQK